MRSLKLLIAGALLFGLAFVAPAQASDEDVVSPAETAAEPNAPSEPTPDEPAASGGEASDPSVGDAIAEATDGADGTDESETAAGAEAANDVVVLATPEPQGDSPPAAPAPVGDALDTADAENSEKAAAVLGEIGYDAEGRQGRIHVVVRGDTLWDISDAYLGTPWVWPSIWTDNRDIENPHRINPGEHIWITDSEMRLLSPAEAEAMLAAGPPELEELPAAQSEPMPVELDSGEPMGGELVAAEQQFRRVSVREWVGLISAEDLEATASIVRPVSEYVVGLSQLDLVYIGIGAGDVEVGDQFDIIRKQEKVEDPETGRFLGYYVAAKGWLEVTEVHEESSLATIRMSMEDIWKGDRLIPRRPDTLDIAVQPSPEDIEGMIAFFPRSRVVIGPLDFVYLNRGTLDGLEAGSPLEVVRGGERVDEPVRGGDVEIPRRVVAQLLVVDSQPETSVALVAHSETDLLVGDSFRGATR